MARKKSTSKRKKINPKLAAMFKMSREELATRKMTGAGIHRPKKPDTLTRGEQKRRAINNQL